MQPTGQAPVKHRWALKNNMMCGLTLPGLAQLLWRHWREIDWSLYAHRVACLAVLAAANSAMGWVDTLAWGRAVAAHRLHPEPLFILGHPRTGTTHVHNLLALDPAFGWATTFDCGFPAACLSWRWLRPLLAGILDDTRPMDGMALSFDTPSEDEIATNVLSGGVSPYGPVVFMRSWRRFERLYTFEGAAPWQPRAWHAAFTHFVSKVSLRCGGRPLLIKSPVHTARVRLLLDMFPRARFVYVHRHPLVVLQSAMHLADSYYPYCSLQRQTVEDVTDFVLHQFQLLHDAYTHDRALIPPGRLVEVGFDELDGDPVSTMRRVYSAFGWGARFEELEPTFRAYCASLAGFTKNDHRQLSPELQALVVQRWAPAFEMFGYAKEMPQLQASRGGSSHRREEQQHSGVPA